MAHRIMREGARTHVADEAETLALIGATEAAFGPIDLFCADAGITARGGVDAPDADWQLVWDVNVMAHMHAGAR